MGKINLKDIAEECGVSISTVSRVINDPDQVQITTRDTVYKAMRDLGYKPSLKSGKGKQGQGAIALITSCTGSEFFTDFMIALKDEFALDNRYILLIDTKGELSLSAFTGRNSSWVDLVDSVIVFYCQIDELARDFLKEHNLPTAVVHSRCPYFYSIMNNDYLGGYDAAAYLWNKGCRRFSLIDWNRIEGDKSRDRKTGFFQFLREKGVDPDTDVLYQTARMTMDGGYSATEKILEKGQPDAVFYTCDTMAMGGIEYCREKGIRIPGDLSIMGFDDIRMAEAMNLTTMKQFISAKARSVSRHILDRLNGAVPPEFPEEVTITPVVVERKTT